MMDTIKSLQSKNKQLEDKVKIAEIKIDQLTKDSKLEINKEPLNIRDIEGKVGQALNRNLKNDSSLTFITSSLPVIKWAMNPLQQVPLNLMAKGSKFEMSEKNYDCDLCNVKSTSRVDLDTHRAGKKHRMKLKMSRDYDSLLKEDKLNEKFGLSEKVFPFGCDLCNVKSTCQKSLDIHRAGKTHQRNLQYGFALS